MNIGEIIQSKYGSFTKKQHQIADYLLSRPAEICYITLADLSKKIGCSELTILKFCRTIGVNNFLELKEAFRQYNHVLADTFSASTISLPIKSADNSDTQFLKQCCEEEMASISRFYSQIDFKKIDLIAKNLMGRRTIYLFAHDVSKTFATFLLERLKIMRLHAVLVDLAEMAQLEKVFHSINKKDAAVLFSFPKYFFAIEEIARNIQEKTGEVVLFTDNPENPATDCTDEIIYCETHTPIFNNSWILPVVAINLLTNGMALNLSRGYASLPDEM